MSFVQTVSEACCYTKKGVGTLLFLHLLWASRIALSQRKNNSPHLADIPAHNCVTI